MNKYQWHNLKMNCKKDKKGNGKIFKFETPGGLECL